MVSPLALLGDQRTVVCMCVCERENEPVSWTNEFAVRACWVAKEFDTAGTKRRVSFYDRDIVIPF